MAATVQAAPCAFFDAQQLHRRQHNQPRNQRRSGDQQHYDQEHHARSQTTTNGYRADQPRESKVRFSTNPDDMRD